MSIDFVFPKLYLRKFCVSFLKIKSEFLKGILSFGNIRNGNIKEILFLMAFLIPLKNIKDTYFHAILFRYLRN